MRSLLNSLSTRASDPMCPLFTHTGFQTDKECEALMTICQGSPCLRSGAGTWVTTAAIAQLLAVSPGRAISGPPSVPCLTAKLPEML